MKQIIALALIAGAATASAADFKLPAFETAKLPNGLTVYLMERHEVPIISVRAVVKAGAVNDGPQAGLANLTGDAILLGSQAHNKAAIDEAFDFRGGAISGGSGTEQSSVQANFARKDIPVLLPLFAELVQQPSFDEKELDKLVGRKMNVLRQTRESPRQVAGTYYRAMLFGPAAYGNPVGGTVNSLGALKQADVKGFHQRYFRPDNAALIVVGDFDPAEMRKQVETLFGQWRAEGPAPQRADYGKVLAEKPRVWLVNKADATETTFLIGGPGVARNDPDYVPLQVLNTVLGGRFTSWLNEELRTNSGLSYGANSSFNPLSQTGTFSVFSFTAQPKTEAALELAHKTYDRLFSKGIDKATLDSAKAYVKGQYPPRFETSEQLAALLGDMYALGVSREQIDNFMRDVDGVTPERAKLLIDKHFPRQNLQMVMVGKAEAIRGIAAKYGEVTELEITADGFQPKP